MAFKAFEPSEAMLKAMQSRMDAKNYGKPPDMSEAPGVAMAPTAPASGYSAASVSLSGHNGPAFATNFGAISAQVAQVAASGAAASAIRTTAPVSSMGPTQALSSERSYNFNAYPAGPTVASGRGGSSYSYSSSAAHGSAEASAFSNNNNNSSLHSASAHPASSSRSTRPLGSAASASALPGTGERGPGSGDRQSHRGHLPPRPPPTSGGSGSGHAPTPVAGASSPHHHHPSSSSSSKAVLDLNEFRKEWQRDNNTTVAIDKIDEEGEGLGASQQQDFAAAIPHLPIDAAGSPVLQPPGSALRRSQSAGLPGTAGGILSARAESIGSRAFSDGVEYVSVGGEWQGMKVPSAVTVGGVPVASDGGLIYLGGGLFASAAPAVEERGPPPRKAPARKPQSKPPSRASVPPRPLGKGSAIRSASAQLLGLQHSPSGNEDGGRSDGHGGGVATPQGSQGKPNVWRPSGPAKLPQPPEAPRRFRSESADDAVLPGQLHSEARAEARDQARKSGAGLFGGRGLLAQLRAGEAAMAAASMGAPFPSNVASAMGAMGGMGGGMVLPPGNGLGNGGRKAVGPPLSGEMRAAERKAAKDERNRMLIQEREVRLQLEAEAQEKRRLKAMAPIPVRQTQGSSLNEALALGGLSEEAMEKQKLRLACKMEVLKIFKGQNHGAQAQELLEQLSNNVAGQFAAVMGQQQHAGDEREQQCHQEDEEVDQYQDQYQYQEQDPYQEGVQEDRTRDLQAELEAQGYQDIDVDVDLQASDHREEEATATAVDAAARRGGGIEPLSREEPDYDDPSFFRGGGAALPSESRAASARGRSHTEVLKLDQRQPPPEDQGGALEFRDGEAAPWQHLASSASVADSQDPLRGHSSYSVGGGGSVLDRLQSVSESCNRAFEGNLDDLEDFDL